MCDRPPHILIVDDEPTILAQLQLAFEYYQAPFKAEFASTNAGARELVMRFCYDAVLLDVDLPDMTGGGAYELYKLDEGLPIALFTNHGVDVVEPILANVPTAVYWYKLDRVKEPEQLIADIIELASRKRCCDDSYVAEHGDVHGYHPRETPLQPRKDTGELLHRASLFLTAKGLLT